MQHVQLYTLYVAAGKECKTVLVSMLMSLTGKAGQETPLTCTALRYIWVWAHEVVVTVTHHVMRKGCVHLLTKPSLGCDHVTRWAQMQNTHHLIPVPGCVSTVSRQLAAV